MRDGAAATARRWMRRSTASLPTFSSRGRLRRSRWTASAMSPARSTSPRRRSRSRRSSWRRWASGSRTRRKLPRKSSPPSAARYRKTRESDASAPISSSTSTPWTGWRTSRTISFPRTIRPRRRCRVAVERGGAGAAQARPGGGGGDGRGHPSKRRGQRGGSQARERCRQGCGAGERHQDRAGGGPEQVRRRVLLPRVPQGGCAAVRPSHGSREPGPAFVRLRSIHQTGSGAGSGRRVHVHVHTAGAS